MSAARVALLVGLFGPPLLLLAMMTPAVAWSEGPLVRELAVHGALLAGSVVGMGSGWALRARSGGPSSE